MNSCHPYCALWWILSLYRGNDAPEHLTVSTGKARMRSQIVWAWNLNHCPALPLCIYIAGAQKALRQPLLYFPTFCTPAFLLLPWPLSPQNNLGTPPTLAELLEIPPWHTTQRFHPGCGHDCKTACSYHNLWMKHWREPGHGEGVEVGEAGQMRLHGVASGSPVGLGLLLALGQL